MRLNVRKNLSNANDSESIVPAPIRLETGIYIHDRFTGQFETRPTQITFLFECLPNDGLLLKAKLTCITIFFISIIHGVQAEQISYTYVDLDAESEYHNKIAVKCCKVGNIGGKPSLLAFNLYQAELSSLKISYSYVDFDEESENHDKIAAKCCEAGDIL